MLPPIYTSALLRPLLDELLTLLRGLTTEQWELPTVAGRWRVRDVAAHLLDGDLRKIAVYRDGHAIPDETPIGWSGDLARFINALNASGVAWAKRLSPRLLVDLLAITGEWVAALLEELPPHGRARFPVSWAGEAESENWMDTGREYTERWHHQMQIRDAVGAPPVLLEPRWLDPLLDISVRALPHSYAEVDAALGTAVVFEVADGREEPAEQRIWSVVRKPKRWALHRGREGAPEATVRATRDAAWRLLYNALPDPARAEGIAIDGDAALAAPLLRTRSVIV